MKTLTDLHDAELYALRHEADGKTVECVFRTSEGEDAVLLLNGVTRFRCTDFGLQNVALELVSTVSQEVGLDDLRSYIAWLSSTADGEQLVDANEIDAIVQSVATGKLHCVFLIPSWGAQLGATAANVQLLGVRQA